MIYTYTSRRRIAYDALRLAVGDPLIYRTRSRAVSWPPRVRDDVADVVHPRAEKNEPLEP
jgi:hypothetical protein